MNKLIEGDETPAQALARITALKKKPKKKAAPTDTWTQRALAYVVSLKSGREVTADDLVESLGNPANGKALGMLFKQAAKKGLLIDTGNTVEATSPKARGRRIRVWKRALSP
jgi:hypothetical protein